MPRVVEPAHEHRARRHLARARRGRQRHRVGLAHAGGDRVVEPAPELLDRIGRHDLGAEVVGPLSHGRERCQTFPMSFHHVAIATKDLDATHRFYTEAMGFELRKVDAIPLLEKGWARHLFYDTGNGELLAIWDLHDETLPDFDPAISTGLGLPNFVNHIAFGASDLDDLDARKDRWLANGHDVVRIDHGWCTSIYANDPNGIMVEFCFTTDVLDDDDRRQAQELLASALPEINTVEPKMEFFEASAK